ncbi:hypothetical protein [Limnoraphis robusta]|uniref:hypothetical protein n=1 Tax=Limnoraphis robusta TaxID=1118279 RepID=UPI00389924EE
MQPSSPSGKYASRDDHFQLEPQQKGLCNPRQWYDLQIGSDFQLEPQQKGLCNCHGLPTEMKVLESFNSNPSKRVYATKRRNNVKILRKSFNSNPSKRVYATMMDIMLAQNSAFQLEPQQKGLCNCFRGGG